MRQWGRLEELEDPGSGRDVQQQQSLAPQHLSAVQPQLSSREKRRKNTSTCTWQELTENDV